MSTDILIIGGDGDLALRKLYPALYYLTLNGCMPENTRVYGMARTPREQDVFLARINKGLRAAVGRLYDEGVWQEFSKCLTFTRGDSTKPAELEAIKAEYFNEDSQLIVYLAVPPSTFGKICSSLEMCSLVRPSTRVVVEKPLGDSKESFQVINAELNRVFDEDQVYRIDHYLGKESVQNLLALRFANDIFEPIWNSKYVDHIQITVSETVGCGGRWKFYEEAGAIRDMVQNHLLQVLCLTCMEPPATLDASCVSNEKLKILRCLKSIGAEDVGGHTVRGQYRAGDIAGENVVGYLDEEDSTGGSDIETYVAIKAGIDNWRWAGTPIYIRTGKRLSQAHAEIVIQFKQTHTSLFDDQLSADCANQLVILLQPDEGIRLRLKNKKAGLDRRFPLEDRSMDLSFEDYAKSKKHDAYTRVLYDVIRNDQTLFVSTPEVEAAWEWVDHIIAGWKSTSQHVIGYEAGSMGPAEADQLMKNDNRKWKVENG